MGIKRGDDDTRDLDPLYFSDGAGEEEESRMQLRITYEDRRLGRNEGDNFRECNDEEDARQGD